MELVTTAALFCLISIVSFTNAENENAVEKMQFSEGANEGKNNQMIVHSLIERAIINAHA